MKHLFKPIPFKTIIFINNHISGEWDKRIHNIQGKLIRFENSAGYWVKWEYDDNGKVEYKENSTGECIKYGYNENGMIYREDNYGYKTT